MSNPDAKVFVTRRRVPEAIDLLGQHFDVEAWEPNSPPPPDVLLEKAAQSNALLTEADDNVHAGLLEAAPSLRVVANRGVGVDNIDIAAATRCGVLVGNTPGILQESCADFTFGLMIAAARRIVHADRQVQAGRWTKFDPMPYVGHDVHGKTLGIVGLGAIGEAVARRAQGFGMTVLYYSRTRKPQAEQDLGVRWTPDLKDLMRASDFVSVHVPLSDETRGIVGEAELAEMKPHALPDKHLARADGRPEGPLRRPLKRRHRRRRPGRDRPGAPPRRRPPHDAPQRSHHAAHSPRQRHDHQPHGPHGRPQHHRRPDR